MREETQLSHSYDDELTSMVARRFADDIHRFDYER